MASQPPFNHDHNNARSEAIIGALQLAKRVVVAQLQNVDPVVLDGIKRSFTRLEEDALKACLPASPPPPPAPKQQKRGLIQTAELGKGLAPPAPRAPEQPKRNPFQTGPLGRGMFLSAEHTSCTVSQSGERSQPPREDRDAKTSSARRGPFSDSSSDEERTALMARDRERHPDAYAAVRSSMATDNGAAEPSVNDEAEKGRKRGGEEREHSEEATSKKRKTETRLPSKYPAANEANLLLDEHGIYIPGSDGDLVESAKRKAWMTAEEEEAFFGRQSFERCFKCSELGHNEINCPQPNPRCKRCDKPHHTLRCRSDTRKCGVCGGPHHRGRRACRKKDKEVLEEKLLIRYYSGELA